MAPDANSDEPVADPSPVYQAHYVGAAVSADFPYQSATAPTTATSVRPEELATVAVPGVAAAAADVAVAAAAESYLSSDHNPFAAVLFAAAVSSAAPPTPSASPLVS